MPDPHLITIGEETKRESDFFGENFHDMRKINLLQSSRAIYFGTINEIHMVAV